VGAKGGAAMSTPIIMWRINFSRKIERVECSKVTEKSVFIVAEPNWNGEMRQLSKPQRESIVSTYRSYHSTWADAHARLLANAESELASIRRNLEHAQVDYGRIKGMKPPADAEVQPDG
jgi:hypothetical protein